MILSSIRNSLLVQSIFALAVLLLSVLLVDFIESKANRKISQLADHLLGEDLPVLINSLEMIDELNDMNIKLYNYANGDELARIDYQVSALEFEKFREEINGYHPDHEAFRNRSYVKSIRNKLAYINKIYAEFSRDVQENVFTDQDPDLIRHENLATQSIAARMEGEFLVPLEDYYETHGEDDATASLIGYVKELQELVLSKTGTMTRRRERIDNLIGKMKVENERICAHSAPDFCLLVSTKTMQFEAELRIYFENYFAAKGEIVSAHLRAYETRYFEPIKNSLDTMSIISNAEVESQIANLHERLQRLRIAVDTATLTSLSVICLLFVVIWRKILLPVQKVSDVLNELRDGNYQVDIPAPRGGDEVSQNYGALIALRGSLRELEELRDSQLKEAERKHFVELQAAYDALKSSESDLRMNGERLQKANAELGQFVHIASHDFREPIKNIFGYSQMLKAREDDPLALQWVDNISENAKRMEILADDLRKLSKIHHDSGEAVCFSMQAVMDQVLLDHQSALENRHAVLRREELPELMGHPQYLQIVFDQIMQNALQYGAAKLEIDIQAKVDAERVEIKFSNNLDQEMERDQRLFLPFARGQNGDRMSSGVGLTVCRKIVEDLHDGKIWICEEDSERFTLIISLPVCEAKRNAS